MRLTREPMSAFWYQVTPLFDKTQGNVARESAQQQQALYVSACSGSRQLLISSLIRGPWCRWIISASLSISNLFLLSKISVTNSKCWHQTGQTFYATFSKSWTWKLKKFSVTQILREIKFGETTRVFKSANLSHFEAMNLDYSWILAEIYKITKFRAPKMAKTAVFALLESQELISRKIE